MVKRHCWIIVAINHIAGSAYIVFGNQDPFWHKPCLSEEKFDKAASNRMEYLDLVINTVVMAIIYPLLKRQLLLDIFGEGWGGSSTHTLKDITNVLGHTCNVSIILPIGSYFSIRIYQCLNACISTSPWWSTTLTHQPTVLTYSVPGAASGHWHLPTSSL